MNEREARMLCEKVPAAMKEARRWVLYGNPNGKDEGRKIPYQLDGRKKASVIDDTTWGAFDDAVQAACQRGFIGVMFALGDGFNGVNFDGLVDPASKTRMAYRAINELIGLIDSYTEYSPSGTGLHTITKAHWPLHINELKKSSTTREHCAIECYSGSRFFTVTGHIYDLYEDVTANHDGFNSFFVEIQELFKDTSHKEKSFNPAIAPRQKPSSQFTPPADDEKLLKAVNISDLTGIIEAGELDDLPEVKALTVKIIETEKQKTSARPEIVVEPYLELASRLYEAGVPISRLADMLSADLRVSISDMMLRNLLSERNLIKNTN